MLDFKKIIKGITVKNGASTASASTKQLSLTVSDSATINTTTTVVSAQTANRTITLPDADGTLLTAVSLAPDSAVITDSNGALSTTTISTTELQSLNGITGVIETRLDDLETSVADLEADPTTQAYVDSHLGGLVFDQTGASVNDVVTYDGTKFVLEPGSASGANNTLSNLTSPTAINQNLIYATAGTTRVIQTAAAAVSDAFSLVTGTASAGNSGAVILGSGSTSVTSGAVSLFTGTAPNASGDITLQTGNATTFFSGAIRLQTGTGPTRGSVFINALALNMGSSKITALAAPTLTTDATNKTYVDSNLGGFTFDQSGAASTNVITWNGSQYELSEGTPILDTMFVAGVASTASIPAGGAIGPFVNGLYDPNAHWDVSLGNSTYTFTDPGIYQINFLAVATAGTINANSFFTVLIFDGVGTSSYPIAHVSTLNYNTTGSITVPVPSVTTSGQITIRWNNGASSNVTVGYRQLSITRISGI